MSALLFENTNPLNTIVVLTGVSHYEWSLPWSCFQAFFFRGTEYYLLVSDTDVEQWRMAVRSLVDSRSYNHMNRLINKHGNRIGVAIHQDFCEGLRDRGHYSLDVGQQRDLAGKARRILVNTDSGKNTRISKWRHKDFL